MLRPFFSFYGSKWRLAPKYPPPEYDTIIEPFAGSAGYSLRYPEKQVILIERDPIIAAIWRWLIAASPDDLLSLPDLRTKGQRTDDYDMPQEARWLMGFWVNQASSHPCAQVTAFNRPDYRIRCANQLQHIRHWTLFEGDYSDAPDITATWFIDPPYQGMGKRYVYGADGINYSNLSAWCTSRSGQVMACENAGAEWLPFKLLTEQHGVTYNGAVRRSQEVIWLNHAAGLGLAA